jgi:hypothetical protein
MRALFMSAFTRSTPELLRNTGRCVAQGLTLAMMISSRESVLSDVTGWAGFYLGIDVKDHVT